MREIKFRAFWKDNLKPVEDFNTEHTIDACNDGSFIVNQFTGLKDKNGKEIYEGDIIKHEEEVTYFIVVFFNGCFFLESVEDNEYNSSLDMTPIEIIGNIYENPELLKQSES